MDPYELLKADHRKVADLFSKLEEARGNAKTSLFNEIRNELELHTHIEEKIFYPAIEKPEPTHDLTLEAYVEHKGVKQLLEELDQSSLSDEWDAKLKVLRENVEHHVDEEEGELFDKAQEVLSDEQAERLGDQMQAEKKNVGGAAAISEPAPIGLIATVKKALGIGKATESAAKKETTTNRATKKSSTPRKQSTKSKGAEASTKKKPSKSKRVAQKTSGKKAASGKAGKKKAAKAKSTSAKRTAGKSKTKATKKNRRS